MPTDSLAGKTPPYNPVAEQNVLGSILLDNDVAPDVLLEVAADDFYRAAHQTIYEHVADLFSKSLPVDTTTLAHALEASGSLEAVGGEDYLAELLNSVPHALNARSYAQIVRQKSIARALIEAAHQTLAEAYSNTYNAEELLNRTEKRVFAISDTGRKQTEITAEEAVRRAIDRLDTRMSGPTGLTCGLPEVDAITAGLQAEELVIVAGRPSMGKSAFAMNLAEHAAIDKKLPVMFYSVEMGHLELAERILSSRGRIPGNLFKKPADMDAGHYGRINTAFESVKKLPWLFNDVSSQTVLSISASARRMKQRRGALGLVVVDYLQLLEPLDPRDSRQEQVALMSRAMKTLARELKCPVVVLSQINRKAEDREDRRPRMADLRESGAIEQDADKVILLHRPEYFDPNDQPGIAEVIVAKNRNGATGTAKVGWSPSLTRFEDLTAMAALPPDAVPPAPRAPVDDILEPIEYRPLANGYPEDEPSAF